MNADVSLPISGLPYKAYADFWSVLLSSHRDYDSEKDWELLRNDSPYGDALVFELQAERSTTGTERFEMVVTDRWTSKVC